MRRPSEIAAIALAILLVATSCSNTPSATTTTAATPTTTTPTTTTTFAIDPEVGVLIGRGVDPETKIISIGILADQTGLFAPLVIDVTDAQKVYWDNVNAAGGIDGWTVELIIENTNYQIVQHQEAYEKIRDSVVAIGQSTGSPMNEAMLDSYIKDSMLVIPLSWYSGWAIPQVDHRVMLEQNTNYCIEAMNILDFINDMGGKTLALATFPESYGQDAAAGVKIAADFYGMKIVYDGEAAAIPGQDQTLVIQGIVESAADWTFLATNPSIGAEILAGAARNGYEGQFTGSVPAYNSTLLDSPAGELYDQIYYQSAYNVAWGTSTPGNEAMMASMAGAFPDRRPSDRFISGWNSAISMHKVLDAAITSGDLTPEGVVAAANSLSEVDFGGSAPRQSYAGTPNEYVQRSLAMFDPDLATYNAAGGAAQTLSQADGTTGSLLVKDFWVGAAAEVFEFTEACYELQGSPNS